MLESLFTLEQTNLRMSLNVTRIVILAFLMTLTIGKAAHSLTRQQEEGMFRHGIWEWSLKTCSRAYRNKGYWFALREVGKFENSNQIRRNEGGKSFVEGWRYMVANAQKFGIESTCNYAFEQWPAVLWRK